MKSKGQRLDESGNLHKPLIGSSADGMAAYCSKCGKIIYAVTYEIMLQVYQNVDMANSTKPLLCAVFSSVIQCYYLKIISIFAL